MEHDQVWLGKAVSRMKGKQNLARSCLSHDKVRRLSHDPQNRVSDNMESKEWVNENFFSNSVVNDSSKSSPISTTISLFLCQSKVTLYSQKELHIPYRGTDMIVLTRMLSLKITLRVRKYPLPVLPLFLMLRERATTFWIKPLQGGLQ